MIIHLAYASALITIINSLKYNVNFILLFLIGCNNQYTLKTKNIIKAALAVEKSTTKAALPLDVARETSTMLLN